MKEILCDDSWMGHCAKYQLHSGGKRFRALLALISSGSPVDQSTVNYAAACCESVYNASLIHDDLVRQRPFKKRTSTIWNRFEIILQ